MPLEVYLDPCTVNSRKVLAGLDLMGKPFKLHTMSYFNGDQKAPDFVKNVNPFATMPAARDGELCITESNAILMYAADSDGGSPAYPKDLKVRADINRWLLWEASAWFPTTYVYLVENVVKPLLGSEADQSILEKENPRFEKNASALEQALANHKFIASDEPTIADIAVASCMHLHEAQKLPLQKFPNITRWIANVELLPAWQKTQPAVDSALLPNKAPAAVRNGLNENKELADADNIPAWQKTQSAVDGTILDNQASAQVRASFNYTKDLGDKLTELYFYEADGVNLKDVHEPGDDPHEMAVHNGWKRGANSFHLDREGFSIHDFNTKYPADKWQDEKSVRDVFYPEIVDFLKRETGAKRVLVFDHTIRSRGNAAKKLTQESNTSQRAPVALVHCDYTAESGPTRVKQLLPDEATVLLKSRVAFYNVWKPLNKVEEQPLAMCDIGSSPPEDFFKLHLRYRDRNGENYVMRHSDKHKWWYFPEMTTDKVIVLKTYESDQDRARFVRHSAFKDPTSREDAPYRESVEIRTIAFF